MRSINYWKQFESTGKIEDYLTYSSHRGEPDGGAVSGVEGKSKESPYAGVRMCDRNDIEADTHRGI
ncbi:MAG: hypothetical protein J1E64_04050 [Acetatifactor sp.]|nr:hypothetical protein [Acetatifactor sp.]